MFRHYECVFPLCTRFLVASDNFPSIFIVGINEHLPCTHVYHRLNGEHHARNKQHALSFVTDVHHIRLFMEFKSNSMSAQVAHNAVMILLRILLDCMSYVANEAVWFGSFSTHFKAFLCHTHQLLLFRRCLSCGLKRKGGMGRSQHEEELAVECGYWHLWRYNPLLADEGKNPFTLDSKAPNWENFRDFLLGEVRYLSVQKAFPKEADELFSQAEKMAKLRYQTYVRKSQEDWSEQI